MGKHEWFTLAEAAEIWGAKDGIADMVRLILEGDVTLTASYILPTPWKASYIKRIEEPSADKEKWYSPEIKEIWSVDIEVRGLIDLDFSGECRDADGSITIRGNGCIYYPDGRWPERGRIYITLPGSSTSLSLISTGETPEELQGCLNIEPEHDLIVTRDHLNDFARMKGRNSVLVKLKSLPASGNVAASEVLIEYECRVDSGREEQQTHVVFDATKSTKKYRVPEGEPVRLASTSGHVLTIGEEPRHILVGFEQEALEKGCIAVEDNESSGIIADFFPDLAPVEPGRLCPQSDLLATKKKTFYDKKGYRNEIRTFMDDALLVYHNTMKKPPNTIDLLMDTVKPGMKNKEGDTRYKVVDTGTPRTAEKHLTLYTKKGAKDYSYDQVKRVFDERKKKAYYLRMKTFPNPHE